MFRRNICRFWLSWQLVYVQGPSVDQCQFSCSTLQAFQFFVTVHFGKSWISLVTHCGINGILGISLDSGKWPAVYLSWNWLWKTALSSPVQCTDSFVSIFCVFFDNTWPCFLLPAVWSKLSFPSLQWSEFSVFIEYFLCRLQFLLFPSSVISLFFFSEAIEAEVRF